MQSRPIGIRSAVIVAMTATCAFGMSAMASAEDGEPASSRRDGDFATAQLAQVDGPVSANTASPEDDTASPEELDTVTVIGSRIVRFGYEAPTPVTVVGPEQIEQSPALHISQTLARLPAFGGAMSTTSGGNEISTGRQSQNNLNLRGLGVSRTLVLLDGHRIVSGDVNMAVNVNDIPQSLIERVEVITGGASAAYGSDALAGVVNFVLDKDFAGVKSNLQGGITGEGDNESIKANLTFGTPFADGRGHVLFSGEYARNNGVFGALASRDWGFDTVHIIANPAYDPAAGQTSVPQFLIANQAATLLAAPGGLITRGPLRGTAFRQDGTPFQFEYGPGSNNQYTVGGDWRLSDVNVHNQSLANNLSRQNYFARVSYDMTDDTNVYVNIIHSRSNGYARSKLDDALNNMTIRRDNPFLGPQIAARMDDLGLDSFVMGSFNLDLPYMGTTNIRRTTSYALGAQGNVDALGASWNWDVYGQVGFAESFINGHVRNKPNFALALDAVRSGGEIVCRVNADASTANDTPACVPWNPFGWGNNGPEAVGFTKGLAELDQVVRQRVFTVGVTGDPFRSWAGPVSLATGVAWREEKVTGEPDPLSLQTVYTAGNYKGTNGQYNVLEGYIESVVPMAADVSWARALDLNGAVRFTDYSTSGRVTTWKLGLTYSPFDDLRFRLTRSRDIRAPNLDEQFAAGGGGQSPGVLDPFNNNAPLPTFQNETVGNPALKPEEADTTGIGLIYQPSWLDGFSAAIDFYDIDIDGVISSVGAQETLNRCFLGQLLLCNNITRDETGQIILITSLPVNISRLHQRGVDIEASYTTELGRGDLSLRALGTHVTFYRRDDGFNPIQDLAGDNSEDGPLNWRWFFSADYSMGPVSVQWAGRYMSSGHYDPRYVQCTANCPVSTPYATTIDQNHIPSRFYHDLSFSYYLEFGEGTTGELFLNIANVLDRQPPAVADDSYWYMPTNPILYDTLGRKFYAGIRFSM